MFHFCFTPNHPECPLQDEYFVDTHTHSVNTMLVSWFFCLFFFCISMESDSQIYLQFEQSYRMTYTSKWNTNNQK